MRTYIQAVNGTYYHAPVFRGADYYIHGLDDKIVIRVPRDPKKQTISGRRTLAASIFKKLGFIIKGLKVASANENHAFDGENYVAVIAFEANIKGPIPTPDDFTYQRDTPSSDDQNIGFFAVIKRELLQDAVNINRPMNHHLLYLLLGIPHYMGEEKDRKKLKTFILKQYPNIKDEPLPFLKVMLK